MDEMGARAAVQALTRAFTRGMLIAEVSMKTTPTEDLRITRRAVRLLAGIFLALLAIVALESCSASMKMNLLQRDSAERKPKDEQAQAVADVRLLDRLDCDWKLFQEWLEAGGTERQAAYNRAVTAFAASTCIAPSRSAVDKPPAK